MDAPVPPLRPLAVSPMGRAGQVSEAEHVRKVAALGRQTIQAQAAELTVRSRRDRAIREALAFGVSDRALAIAAMLNPPRIRQIQRGQDRGIPDVVQPLGVNAVNGTYPCCAVDARFQRDEVMDPGAEIIKRCPRCKKPWVVTRSVLASTDRGRVDELHWTDPSK